jgi:hypothetical protein
MEDKEEYTIKGMWDASTTTTLNPVTTSVSGVGTSSNPYNVTHSTGTSSTIYVPHNYGIGVHPSSNMHHATMSTTMADSDKIQKDAILRYLMSKGVDKVTPEMAAVLGMKTISINTHLAGGPIKKLKKHKKLEFKI